MHVCVCVHMQLQGKLNVPVLILFCIELSGCFMCICKCETCTTEYASQLKLEGSTLRDIRVGWGVNAVVAACYSPRKSP